MGEDFVTFELAKKLKKKGFWYTTDTLYFKDGGIGVYKESSQKTPKSSA